MLEQIKRLGSEERAARDQLYHKSRRIHWGAPAPQTNELVRSVAKNLSQEELLSLAKELWETDLFDPMVCAGKLLTRAKPTPAVWNLVNYFLTKVDGWALEDILCHIAWKCILADETRLDEVEKWTAHPNFWWRRAALVYTLPYAKPGRNPDRMLEWASSYATDPEWFIQKAIGWWLRVLGEHDPDKVLIFLKKHWPVLKGVARKEATRKLSIQL